MDPQAPEEIDDMHAEYLEELLLGDIKTRRNA